MATLLQQNDQPLQIRSYPSSVRPTVSESLPANKLNYADTDKSPNYYYVCGVFSQFKVMHAGMTSLKFF